MFGFLSQQKPLLAKKSCLQVIKKDYLIKAINWNRDNLCCLKSLLQLQLDSFRKKSLNLFSKTPFFSKNGKIFLFFSKMPKYAKK